MSGKAGKQVKAWTDKAKRRQEAIVRESASRVWEIASTPIAQGGRMPVDTGFLRGSARGSTDGMPSSSGAPPELIFATIRVGQTVWVGWTAVYALRQEYGFFGKDSLGREYSQHGKAFMRTAVQQWPQIVASVTAEVNARIR